MALPKKIKKYIPLSPQRTLISRRYELAEMIEEKGTYLPKSLLHADLDGGMLDFVKEDLSLVVSGKKVPVVDILITTQNWAQFTETWNFQDLDKNVSPPFISVVRSPEVKYGTNPALMYNIPNRRQYYYAVVPTWDGNRSGADVYKIPQPVPVDITYSIKIICNRMRELNKFNQIILEKFASRQAYRNIKGHYIPIIMNNISDESVMDIEKRKYYVQSYEFIMLGFLIDEDEFQVAPAVSRQLTLIEGDQVTRKRRAKSPKYNFNDFDVTIDFLTGETSTEKRIEYTSDMNIINRDNVLTYDIYINGDFYGSDISLIQVNTNDILKIDITKIDPTKIAQLYINSKLL